MGEQVNLSKLKDKLFLIKVPKYVSECWKSYSQNEVVGEIRYMGDITKSDLYISESIYSNAKMSAENKNKKKNYFKTNFQISKEKDSLVVCSSNSNNSERAAVGHVDGKIELQPFLPNNAKAVKNSAFLRNEPRTVKLLDTAVATVIKPVAYQKEENEEKLLKKFTGKRVRLNEDDLRELIFEIFTEKKQLSYRELLERTNQPEEYLKQVLKQVCVSNKNVWQLKEEYRH